MSQEALFENLSITGFSALNEDMGSFCESETYSDIIFTVDDCKIPAHKVVLAARSKYFKELMEENPKQDNFSLPNTPLEAFRKILRYIYTGSMTVTSCNGNLISDVLNLAHKYSLQSLVNTMTKKITSILDMSNVYTILNAANNCEIDELRHSCHNVLDEHVLEILETDDINVLTEKSMIKLLERDSFGLHEIEIFEIVEKWCKYNHTMNDGVIQCVRLMNLSNEEILTIVWPSKLIEDAKLLSVLKQITTDTTKLKNRHIKPLFIKDQNIAQLNSKVKVVTGANVSMLLTNQENVTAWAYHIINDKNGVTVDLRQSYRLNHIKMTLPNEYTKFDDNIRYRFYQYYIEVSQDRKLWQNIVDYSRNYNCRSYQNLYFEQTVARYIRIVGKCNSQNQNFELANLEIYCASEIPELVDGIVCPIGNVASTNMGAHTDTFINLWKHNESSDVHLKKKIMTIQLAQPYMISTIRVEFTNIIKNCKYSIYIKSTNSSWTPVVKNVINETKKNIYIY